MSITRELSLQQRTINAGGFHTAYVECGDPQAETIVLLHDGAFGTTAELCWGDVMLRLADRYHVVAPDLLGWGGTDKVVYLDRSPYAGRIAHVAAFCDALGITRAHFAGVSFGASMLMRAIADPAGPLPVERAVSIAGAGGAYRDPEGTRALGEYTPSLEDAARLTSYCVASMDGLEDHVRQRFENSLILGHWEALSAPRLANPSAPRAAVTDTFFDDLSRATTPILVIEGSQDRLMESGWAARVAEGRPHITSIVGDFAHEPNIDRPEWTAETIAAFFSGATA